jgi:hypothetical protein
VVGARTVGPLWNDVSSTDPDYCAIPLDPSMDGLVVIVQTFTAGRHAERLT